MGDKCRRYVADPNIGCFKASRCGAIAYREKMYFIAADVMGWG